MGNTVSGKEIGVRVQQAAKDIARDWRRLVGFELVKERKTPQLGDVVEPLVRQIGLCLSQGETSPGAAWGAVNGVLRLSPSRGSLGLFEEFAGLRRVLREFLMHHRAPSEVKEAADAMLDAAVDAALTELKATALPPAVLRSGFRGSVVVLFERPRPPRPESRPAPSAVGAVAEHREPAWH